MIRLEIQIRLELGSALHVTGNRRVLGVDRPLALGASGKPVIPATTIKGFLRDRAEQLLMALGQSVCRSPQPECWKTSVCRVCRVFGNGRMDAAIRFTDAVPTNELSEEARAGVAISRSRRAAIPQRLFFVQTTPPGPSSWRCSCRGYFGDVNAAREAAALIDLACRWPLAIGSGKTRGLGWIREIDLLIEIDGAPVERQDLITVWQAWRVAPHVATP